MPENESLSKISLNARAYWRADGIPALVVGLAYTMVVGSVVTLFLVALNYSPDWNWLTQPILVLWLPGAVIFSVWLANNYEEIVEWMKVRITYPRTGYVAPPSYWNQPEQERASRSIDAWMERYPVRWRIYRAAWTCSYTIYFLWIIFRPVWLARFTISVWPWICAAVVLMFVPSLLRDYARRLKTSKLYWLQIFSVPVFLILVVFLTGIGPIWGCLLLWLFAVMGDSTGKLPGLGIHWIELGGLPLYLLLLIWMMKKDAGWGAVMILVTPGIYLIVKGSSRLIRYLYLHRATHK